MIGTYDWYIFHGTSGMYDMLAWSRGSLLPVSQSWREEIYTIVPCFPASFFLLLFFFSLLILTSLSNSSHPFLLVCTLQDKKYIDLHSSSLLGILRRPRLFVARL